MQGKCRTIVHVNVESFITVNAVFSHILAVPHRFSLAFESKIAEVDAAQTRLNTLTQRLTFAKGRVETIQGVITMEVYVLVAVLQFELHMSGKESASQCFCFSGLIMRRVALQRVQQASKQAEQVADRYEVSPVIFT